MLLSDPSNQEQSRRSSQACMERPAGTAGLFGPGESRREGGTQRLQLGAPHLAGVGAERRKRKPVQVELLPSSLWTVRANSCHPRAGAPRHASVTSIAVVLTWARSSPRVDNSSASLRRGWAWLTYLGLQEAAVLYAGSEAGPPSRTCLYLRPQLGLF